MSLVWKAILALAGLSFLFGVLLAIASVRFRVETDPRVDEIMDVILGSNCGACGYPGCQPAAEAVVAGAAPVDVCVAGGRKAAEGVARVMGVPLEMRERGVALVHCKGGLSESVPKALYLGISSCAAADKIAGGGKACSYGCLGLGTCRDVCPVNAIIIDPDHRRWVDRDRCTGCGLCVEACPREPHRDRARGTRRSWSSVITGTRAGRRRRYAPSPASAARSARRSARPTPFTSRITLPASTTKSARTAAIASKYARPTLS